MLNTSVTLYSDMVLVYAIPESWSTNSGRIVSSLLWGVLIIVYHYYCYIVIIIIIVILLLLLSVNPNWARVLEC